MTPFIVTLTGPTCAGKTTLESLLRDAGFASVVSTTTRSPRASEIDGQHYNFVTPARFRAMIEAGELVEHAEFGGNFYGMSVAEVKRASSYGAPIVAVIEPIGRNSVAEFCERNGWVHHAVYVGNPDDVIAERFLERFAHQVECGKVTSKSDVREHAKRLSQMMTTERAWVCEAHFQQNMNAEDRPYDRLLFQFDETNDAQVVQSIIEEFRLHKLNQERLAA